MRKNILTAILLALGVGGFAQPKVGGEMPLREKRGFDQRTIIDTATVRVLYALNAEDIADENTYIDLGRLELGPKAVKYSSEIVHRSDEYVKKWMKETNWKYTTVYTSRDLGMTGPEATRTKWSELTYDDYIIQNKELTDWACFAQWGTWDNCRYTEPWPLMTWELHPDTMTIIGYHCQKATCTFRGRNFEAWFSPEFPSKNGPWKFGGLPGLIMKVQDEDGYYRWEAVGVEKGIYPIEQYHENLYPVAKRERVWKLQKAYNVNWLKSVGAIPIDGQVWKDNKFEQLEKELH